MTKKKAGTFDEAIYALMLAVSATWTDAEIDKLAKHKITRSQKEIGVVIRATIAFLKTAERCGPNLNPYILFKAYARAQHTSIRKIAERRTK